MPVDIVIETVQAMHAMQLSMSAPPHAVEMPATAPDIGTHQSTFSPCLSPVSFAHCIDTYA